MAKLADAQVLGTCAPKGLGGSSPLPGTNFVTMSAMQQILQLLLGFRIYAYGVGITAIFLVALFYFWREIQRTSLNEEKVFDILFVSIIAGLSISRVVFVSLHWELFKPFLVRVLIPLTFPGFDVVGFILGFFFFLDAFCSRYKIDFFLLTKHLVFPLLLTRILIAVLSFALTFSISFVPEALLLLLFMWLLTYIQTAIKEDKFPSEAVFYFYLIAVLFTSYVVDFFHTDRVYFLSQKIVSVEQVLMIAGILFTLRWWVPFFFSSKLSIQSRKK